MRAKAREQRKNYFIANDAEIHVRRFIRLVLAVVFAIWVFCLLYSLSFAASDASAVIENIQIAPATVASGKYPDIVAKIASLSDKRLEVTIITVLTQPDHMVKSWVRKAVALVPGERTWISVPKEYDTKRAGVYKVEFVIYSADMLRQIQVRSQTFTVTEMTMPPQAEERRAKGQGMRGEMQERTYLGVGVYGNSLNPAGGATILLWPFRSVGLQGIYTVGQFTSYEGRVLVKIESQSGLNPYLGAGYLHVSRKENIIGVDTTFEDSDVSGVAGVEAVFGRQLRGYMEVSGTGIKLEKDVTGRGQTVHATVKYIPVTIGLGLVLSVL